MTFSKARRASCTVAWLATVVVTCATLAGLVPVARAGTGAAAPVQATGSSASQPGWVERSNAHAQVLIDALAAFNPEMAGQFGVEGMDDRIIDLRPRVVERSEKALVDALSVLKQRLQTERDPLVRQDLEILVQAAQEFLEQGRMFVKHQVPYFNMSQTVFLGLRALLDDQVPAERRAKALVRLQRYAGLEKGYEPITQLAMDRTRERLSKPGLLGPIRDEVERDLATGSSYLGGIEQLFQQYQLAGYEDAYAQLKQQLADYDAFVRREILPRARTDFRQPPEMYAMLLRQTGIDMPVDELVSRAEVAFTEIRNEMQALAPLVAKEKGFTVTDYRDVLRELKKDQVVGEAILRLYQQRIQDLEGIIRTQHIVTLPDRPMRVRLASEAESASVPAPHMQPPRMIGNTGEMGEFVLPLRVPAAAGQMQQFDDFSFGAASWTLTAHEGRPGHELQFASTIERGVSIARAIFALNSVNVEGWALYSEAEAKPYMPLDGQLVCLQHRLLRAARAILDPGLQMGKVTREEALRVLRDEVVLSEAMANQEVQRYTFRSPGQAPSYFCGYTRLMGLRTETERALGKSFDRQKYHDFLLLQGALPPRLLRKAVMEEFIPQQTPSAQQPPPTSEPSTRR